MKKLTVLVLATLTLVSFKPPKLAFPSFTGKDLEGKTVNFPNDAKGKYSLIALAISLKAQNDLSTWYQPVTSSILGNPFFPVNLYFVPVVGDRSESAEQKLEAALKKNVDKDLYKNVVIFNGEKDALVKTLKMTEKDKPYFFVVDPDGNITFTSSGGFTEKKLEEITDHLSGIEDDE